MDKRDKDSTLLGQYLGSNKNSPDALLASAHWVISNVKERVHQMTYNRTRVLLDKWLAAAAKHNLKAASII
jgi:hypothetical protein